MLSSGLKSPVLNIQNQLQPMAQSKSKQLNSMGTITEKVTSINIECIKIISVLSESTSTISAINTSQLSSDPIDYIACLLDEILNLVSLSHGSTEMETMLQKQENLNRGLIRKEMLYREENENISEQLESAKKDILKLDQKIEVLKEEIKDKDLTILHLKNELRASHKERQFFDDSKIMNVIIDKKLKSTVSKEIEKEIVKSNGHSIHKLGNHNRRKSEDTSKKLAKKDKKERSESKKKNLVISSYRSSFQK